LSLEGAFDGLHLFAQSSQKDGKKAAYSNVSVGAKMPAYPPMHVSTGEQLITGG